MYASQLQRRFHHRPRLRDPAIARHWRRCLALEQLEPRQLLASFTVNSVIDRPDTAPGDGKCEATAGLGDCTLRAAVQEANALSLPDQIRLPAGEYLLTLGGTLEDNAAAGDLDIREAVTIVGAGAADSIINGAGLDRVFHVFAGAVEIRGVTIANGAGVDDGGGVLVVARGSRVTIAETTISNNIAAAQGGGVFNAAGSVVEILRTTVQANDAGINGGGLFNEAGSQLELTNSTVSSNTSLDGAAIYNNGQTVLSNGTIADNDVLGMPGNSPGAALHTAISIGQTTLRNTIVADTLTGSNCGGQPALSAGFNLDTDGTCRLSQTGDVVGSAQLGPLQDNGGPTPTHAIGPQSLARDGANPTGCTDDQGVLLTSDQRGLPRPANSSGGATCDIGSFELQPASISGVKFDDLMGDGFSTDDLPLSGITMKLFQDDGNLVFDPQSDVLVETLLTEADGSYRFTNLTEGTYYVLEDLVGTNRVQTAGGNLENAYYTILLDPEASATGNDFANFQLIAISGRKFDDRNGDGDDEQGADPGVAGVTIFLDGNGNGTLDASERSTLTDSLGGYRFDALGPGVYRVREITPQNAVPTTAPPADIAAVSGQDVAGVDFGNFRVIAISGRKFDDRNGDGDDEQGADPGVAGVTIFLDGNSNGTLDASERSTLTDSLGGYRFDALGPGVYRVREITPQNAVPTTPPADIAAASGQDEAGVDWGNFQLGEIRGQKVDDANGNGQRDAGELGIDGWTIELRDMATGALTAAQQTTSVDLNGDGTIDAATERGMYRFVGIGLGRYEVREVAQPAWEQTFPRGRFVQEAALQPGIVASGARAADLDGDRDADLVVITDVSRTLAVFINGANGFEAPREVPLGGRPSSVTLTDINGDDLVDALVTLVAEPLIPNGSGAVVTLLNRGGGDLAFGQRMVAGNGPLAAAAADVNADGLVDLAVASLRSNDVSILLQRPDGSFAAPISIRAPDQPVAVALEDLNGDLAADLVVAGFRADSVWVFFNLGGGALGPAVELPAGDGPAAVLLRDVNGDQRVDVVATNHLSNNLYLWTNNGANQFSAPVIRPVGQGPKGVAAGDVNRDGATDLLVANSGEDSVTVLYNDGQDAWTQSIVYAAGAAPETVVAGDWDGDGDLDLATPDFYGSDVAILINDQGTHRITIDTSGQVESQRDFGNLNIGGVVAAGEGERPYHNRVRPLDVSNDGLVTPSDALLIVNDLNTWGPRSLWGSSDGEGEPGGSNRVVPPRPNGWLDTSGDNYLTAVDVLLVVNALNHVAAGEGEVPPPLPWTAVDVLLAAESLWCVPVPPSAPHASAPIEFLPPSTAGSRAAGDGYFAARQREVSRQDGQPCDPLSEELESLLALLAQELHFPLIGKGGDLVSAYTRD